MDTRGDARPNGQTPYRFPGMVDTARAIPMFRRWGGELKIFEAELEKASVRSDEEFMGIGLRLDDFHSRAGNIFSMSSAAAGLLRGGEIKAAITGLQKMLESFKDSMQDSENDIESFIEGFGRIKDTVDGMKDRLGNIGAVCRGLRKHSTTMKIYSAQLAGADADFGVLADDVRKLSEIMEVRTTGISAELEVLGSQVSQTMTGIRKLAEKHRSETASILKRIAASIISLNRKYDAASAMATEIREMSREVSSHIGNIVSSVQFHDITNQQIQRAKRMMCNLSSLLEGDAPAGLLREQSGILQTINVAGFACGIQADHLSSAEKELNRAVKEIVQGLGGIAESVSEMSGMILETSLNSGDSLLEDIKNGLTAASAAFFEIAENKKEFSRAAESALGIESKIRSFIGDLEDIGDDIGIITLNAGIKAAQIGNRGTAVSVIASSMQRILTEAQGLTDAALECDFSIDLNRHESGEVYSIIRDLQSLVESVNQVDEDLSEVTAGLSIESKALSEDIGYLAEGMTVHERLSGSIGKVVTGLLGIMKECESFFRAGHFSVENFDRNLLEAQLNMVSFEEEPDSVPESAVSLQRVHQRGGTVEFF